LTSLEDRIAYSYDGGMPQHLPDLVVLPESTEEVAEVMRTAEANRIPVVPRGAGTGLAGGSVPEGGGVVVALTRLNRLLEVDQSNRTATVEAGVVTGQLQTQVEALGLFYPPDPASIHQSTIGGNVATNAGGPRCVKYGVTGNYVLGLTVVLADGRALRTGSKTARNAAGYSLTHLFIGSEGTLGIITEVTVRLITRPKAFRTALVTFSRLDDVSIAIQRILHDGQIPSTINTVEEYVHMGLPVEADALLLIETDGRSEEEAEGGIRAVAEVCRRVGASKIEVAHDSQERERLWAARRAVGPSVARRAPGLLGEDISVPLGAIAETVRRLQELPRRFGLPMVIYGHAGDGNLHPNILFDPREASQLAIVERMVEEIFRIAVGVGGTLSGEHGVGLTRRPYLKMALSPIELEALQRIKRTLDPKGILNPGKVFPLEYVDLPGVSTTIQNEPHPNHNSRAHGCPRVANQ
jgi:glycolate oxidase